MGLPFDPARNCRLHTTHWGDVLSVEASAVYGKVFSLALVIKKSANPRPCARTTVSRSMTYQGDHERWIGLSSFE
jgi:hypothetical protein